MVATTCALLLAACSAGDGGRFDTIAGVTSGARTAASDTVAAVEEDTAAERAAPRDADHALLRELADHYEAAVALGNEAMTRGATGRTRADAHRLHTTIESQRDSLVALVRARYGEQLVPRQAPASREVLERLRRLSGPPHDRAFYEAAIAHQLAGAELVEQRLPQLVGEDVRRLAQRAGDQHRQRAEELERSARGP